MSTAYYAVCHGCRTKANAYEFNASGYNVYPLEIFKFLIHHTFTCGAPYLGIAIEDSEEDENYKNEDIDKLSEEYKPFHGLISDASRYARDNKIDI